MATLVPGANFGKEFTNFNILQATYKIVDGHEIRADLLIPKSLSKDKAPVIARFHGGGLVRGDSIYAAWFPLWVLELAEEHSAVIVSANYRFLPEVTGLDVLDDVDDFWTWLHSEDLTKILKQQEHPISLDLDRILTAGDSAGGLLSVYLTLSQPDNIRAGTAAYPALHWDNPPLLPSTISAFISHVPESFIDEYLTNIKPGHVESSDLALQRVDLSSAITANQRGYGFYIRGSDASSQRDRLYQLSRLDKADARLPRGGLVILHGVDDDLVPIGASERFVDKARNILKDRQGGDRVVLSQQPGGHGFDVNASAKEQWLADALKVAIDTWLE
ncbi:Alpha/Beta hydrolase protein [Talaromyces proteolyticus]|uniref:Alpha/Beta hydrolase protein n=1 Tax=Talaromyces proteolyticus TaxID=1131652 RepID=A0AAD4Q4L2_9EURO|nr:Alpha/Beta hydrolase protein [Talaromyces proteolyticus]KAH8703219.1 Alpha/Beta hydrolase protein [Talaromyces proteolyticus]